MKNLRRGMVLGLVLLTLAVVTPLAVRWATAPTGPSLWIELPNGVEKRVGLADLRRLAQISRRGEVQNQFGNWRDGGTYTGALLADVLRGIPYASIDVVAADGYRMAVDRARVENEEYPMVLAYALDGLLVPTWVDGFRIVVLPDRRSGQQRGLRRPVGRQLLGEERRAHRASPRGYHRVRRRAVRSQFGLVGRNSTVSAAKTCRLNWSSARPSTRPTPNRPPDGAGDRSK